MAVEAERIVSRRSVVAGGLGAAVAAILPLWATPGGFKVPIIDALTLTVLTDSGTFGPFLPDLNLPGLTVLRSGNGSPPGYVRMSPKALMGEFGLSLLAESRVGTTWLYCGGSGQ
jgi:7,8-dihydropterin-6-yl-methyl-4-(beta-D-ribofuranosyl)aminobenzene 5'-phosphate synthase